LSTAHIRMIERSISRSDATNVALLDYCSRHFFELDCFRVWIWKYILLWDAAGYRRCRKQGN